MTLTQLSAFVLVARLGSVKAAADALGVSESAVSQALTALRADLGDPLIARVGRGMTLTAGGQRLLPIASQMVALGAEAEAAVRAAHGSPDELRVIATAQLAEFAAAPLVEAFVRRTSKAIDVNFGVAASAEMAVLVANRLADVALGPNLHADPSFGLVSEPVFRGRTVVVAAGQTRLAGPMAQWQWLVDPSGTDPGSDSGWLLRHLRVPESRVRVFPNQTAAWAAAAAGEGVAPAPAHLVARQLQRGELTVVETPATPVDFHWYVTTLRPDRRPTAAGSLRRFLATPEAMQLMATPGAGVPPSRFRPPVFVTIWS
jgi:DNA-binding transcriptional LysR family regulator